MKKSFLLLWVLLISAGSVFAGEDKGFYLGVGLGQTAHKCDCVTVDNEFGHKAFLGYDFSKYIGAELGYARTKSSIEDNYLDLHVNTAYMAVVGKLPLADDFSLVGKLGVASSKAKISDETDSLSFDRETHAMFGLGGHLDLSKHMKIGVEYDRYHHKTSNVPSTSLVTVIVKLAF